MSSASILSGVAVRIAAERRQRQHVRDHRRIVGEADVEDEPVAADAELQRVGTVVASDRPELVLLKEIIDCHPPLMLDIVIGSAERSFVESHRRETVDILFAGCAPRHQRAIQLT